MTLVRPLEPTTCARTTRGEKPRCSTLIDRKWPLTSPLSLAPACASVIRYGPHRWRGETESNGSLTPRSHGRGSEPVNEFSTFSVMPPLVEKKYVTTGLPP